MNVSVNDCIVQPPSKLVQMNMKSDTFKFTCDNVSDDRVMRDWSSE